MSSLRQIEKRIIESMFDMNSGYVLDFTNPTFAEFFRESLGIDIYANKYAFNGDSKAKRFRAFWEIESDERVGKALQELLEVWKYEQSRKSLSSETHECHEYQKIINRLLGKKPVKIHSEADFLNREFSNLDLTILNIDVQLESVIEQRIKEIEKSLASGASLAVIFLCGSTIEGLLQDVAAKHPREFNTARAAAKKDGKALPFQDWTLNTLIDVAHETKMISADIKEFAHSVKHFRNYIHPRMQAVQQFNPDQHTAEIAWKVLQATIADLSGLRK